MSTEFQLNPKLYHAIVQSLHDAVIAIDAAGIILLWNQGAEKLFGYSAEERLGQPLSLIIPERFKTAHKAGMKRYLETRIPHIVGTTLETTACSRDGRELPIELTISPFECEDGLIYICTIRDITKRKEHRHRLQETEYLFHILSENAQDVITYYIPGQGLVFVSPSARHLLGHEPDDLISGTDSFSFHPDDQPIVDELSITTKKGQEVHQCTTRVRHKDGHYIWFETTFKIMKNSDGTISGILGIGRDISQRKAIQERCERAQKLAKLGHWEYRFSGDSIYLSDEVYHMFGLNPGDPITLDKLASRLHPQDRERVLRSFAAAEKGLPYDIDYRVVRQDGEVRFIHTQGELMYDGNIAVGLFGSLQDITDRKRIEDDLRRSKEGLKLAHGIAGLGHWDRDLRNGEIYWSSQMFQIWGIDPDQFGGTADEIMSRVHPEDTTRVNDMIDHATDGTMSDAEFRVIRPDKSIRIVHSVAKVLLDDDGIPVRVFGITQDITERKRTEDMLIRSEMLSAVGQLAAGLAHEIRNPLTSLIGFTKLLLSERDHKYSDIMQSELKRIEFIVNELLVLAKPQAVKYKPNNVKTALEEVITLLEAQAVLHNVTLIPDLEDCACAVNCEPNQLKQVFINLIKNGIEAMESGGNLQIKLSCQPAQVIISFEDEGNGIPPEILENLGQPFVSTKQNGVGLGLMVCHKIIQDHLGTLDVHSTVDVGTAVTVTLPTV